MYYHIKEPIRHVSSIKPFIMKTRLMVLCLLIFGLFQTSSAQKKDVEAVETYMDLKPLEVSVEFKKDTFFFFLTFQKAQNNQAKSWKLLVSKDARILPALQTSSLSDVKFESVLFTKKGNKRLWRKARNKFDIDKYSVEPYKLWLIFNTSVTLPPPPSP